MKKLLLLFIFILVFATSANAFNPLQVCTGAVESSGCTSPTSEHDGFFDDSAVGGRTGYALLTDGSAVQFTLTSNSTIDHYKLSVVCSPTGGAVDMAIYNDSSNTLGTIVADTTIAITSIVNTGWTDSTGAPLRTATLAAQKSLSSGTYWLRAVTTTGTCVTSYVGSGGDSRTISNGDSPLITTNLYMGVFGCTP